MTSKSDGADSSEPHSTFAVSNARNRLIDHSKPIDGPPTTSVTRIDIPSHPAANALSHHVSHIVITTIVSYLDILRRIMYNIVCRIAAHTTRDVPLKTEVANWAPEIKLLWGLEQTRSADGGTVASCPSSRSSNARGVMHFVTVSLMADPSQTLVKGYGGWRAARQGFIQDTLDLDPDPVSDVWWNQPDKRQRWPITVAARASTRSPNWHVSVSPRTYDAQFDLAVIFWRRHGYLTSESETTVIVLRIACLVTSNHSPRLRIVTEVKVYCHLQLSTGDIEALEGGRCLARNDVSGGRCHSHHQRKPDQNNASRRPTTTDEVKTDGPLKQVFKTGDSSTDFLVGGCSRTITISTE